MKAVYNFEYRNDFIESHLYFYLVHGAINSAFAKKDPRSGRFYAWRRDLNNIGRETVCVPVYLDTVRTCMGPEMVE